LRDDSAFVQDSLPMLMLVAIRIRIALIFFPRGS